MTATRNARCRLQRKFNFRRGVELAQFARFTLSRGGQTSELPVLRHACTLAGANAGSPLPPFRFARYCLLFLALAACLAASEPAPLPWVDPNSGSTRLLISNGYPAPEAIAKFQELAGAGEQEIIVVPSSRVASELASARVPGLLVYSGPYDEAQRADVIAAVSEHPTRVGVCLEENSSLAILGRRLHAVGAGRIHFFLAASAGRPLREIELLSGGQHDLTMLRRAALERSRSEFPPSVAPTPTVERGALVIVGGGALPGEIVQAFIELAGGPNSPIVVLPIAAGDTLAGDPASDTRLFTRAGATNVKSLRARDLSEVTAPEFAATLNEAKGVWFGGGRQWRFVDAYLGTPAEALLRAVLQRGGVIGGSSAGASIQGQYLPRGSPLGNTEMLAEGYERGLGFLPGVAIDQHFTERKRHANMTRLVLRYPQFLGIGIDEGTALVVCGSDAKVIGRGQAYFYDYRCGPPGGERDYVILQPSKTYDLRAR